MFWGIHWVRAAVLREWDSIQSALGGLESHLRALQARPFIGDPHGPAYRGLRTLLFQAQHNLRKDEDGWAAFYLLRSMPSNPSCTLMRFARL